MIHELLTFRLRNAPRSLKALAWGYTLSLSLAYVYAIGNIALVVGLTPKDIAIHYYGASTRISDAPLIPSGESELSLDDLSPTAQSTELSARPSFKNLVGVGHFHLFGMSSFFFGLTLLGLFTKVNDKWKSIMVFTPYLMVVIDNLSFLATRFLGPGFAYLTAISGALMGLSFSVLWFFIIRELLAPKET